MQREWGKGAPMVLGFTTCQGTSGSGALMCGIQTTKAFPGMEAQEGTGKSFALSFEVDLG